MCLMGTLEVTTPMPGQCVPVSGQTCPNNYYVIIANDICFLFSVFQRLHLVHNIIWSARLTTFSLFIANMQHKIYDYKHKVVKYHEYTFDYQIQ